VIFREGQLNIFTFFAFDHRPPNSTGAYELDLSLVKNFNLAYREMHVKTDLFCGSNVVLPDKAGRQITLGGFSGVALSGVRLYTPNGKAGVNGTNDWQENSQILSLQVRPILTILYQLPQPFQ